MTKEDHYSFVINFLDPESNLQLNESGTENSSNIYNQSDFPENKTIGDTEAVQLQHVYEFPYFILSLVCIVIILLSCCWGLGFKIFKACNKQRKQSEQVQVKQDVETGDENDEDTDEMNTDKKDEDIELQETQKKEDTKDTEVIEKGKNEMKFTDITKTFIYPNINHLVSDESSTEEKTDESSTDDSATEDSSTDDNSSDESDEDESEEDESNDELEKSMDSDPSKKHELQNSYLKGVGTALKMKEKKMNQEQEVLLSVNQDPKKKVNFSSFSSKADILDFFGLKPEEKLSLDEGQVLFDLRLKEIKFVRSGTMPYSPRDGSCLIASLHDQVQNQNHNMSGFTYDLQSFRVTVANTGFQLLKSGKLCFSADPDYGGKMENWLKKMILPTTFGDEIFLHAAANHFSSKITIYTAIKESARSTSGVYEIHPLQKPMNPTLHLFLFSESDFHLGHYESIFKADDKVVDISQGDLNVTNASLTDTKVSNEESLLKDSITIEEIESQHKSCSLSDSLDSATSCLADSDLNGTNGTSRSKSVEVLNSEISKQMPKTIPCSRCPRMFKREGGRDKHMKEIHEANHKSNNKDSNTEQLTLLMPKGMTNKNLHIQVSDKLEMKNEMFTKTNKLRKSKKIRSTNTSQNQSNLQAPKETSFNRNYRQFNRTLPTNPSQTSFHHRGESVRLPHQSRNHFNPILSSTHRGNFPQVYSDQPPRRPGSSVRISNSHGMFRCQGCPQTFPNNYTLNNHLRNFHNHMI